MNLNLEAVGANFLVMLQRIERPFGCAEKLDVHLAYYVADTEIRRPEHLAAGLVDAFSSLGAQKFIFDAEGVFQLQVRPVIERISKTARHGLRPSLELLVVTCIAGDIFFRHAVSPHRPPLVMVAVEPGLGYIIEPMVGGDKIGRQVTVIVVNGHSLCVLVVKNPGCFGLQ